MDDGPEVVQLNITDVSQSDSGKWRCRVEVNDTCVYRTVGGKLEKQQCDATVPIGHIYYDIELSVVGK